MTRAEEASPYWRFRPISGPRAYEEVVDQITFAIRSCVYRPGDRLPHVEELARAMKVSAPTIGEAIKVLSKARVVSAQRGINGGLSVVSDRIPNSIMALSSSWRDASPLELVEARRPIEVRLALLAAERGTERDLEMMEYSIKRLVDNAHNDLGSRIYYDHLFHYLMGRAARSRVLAYCQHQILEQLLLKMRPYFEVYEDVEEVISMHKMTLEALRTKDPHVIKRSIFEHLQPLEKQVVLTGEAGLSKSRPRRKQTIP